MEHADLESTLKEFKRAIPVNSQLKERLRGSLRDGTRKGHKIGFLKKALTIGAVAAMALMLILPRLGGNTISASALKVRNQISFLDVGGGSNLGVSPYKDALYVPVSGLGIFVYDENGFSSVCDKEAGWVRVSADGKRLALSSGGTVGILDMESGQFLEVLKGDDTTYYEEPSWSPEGQKLIYTRKVIEPSDSHGFSVKELAVWEISLDTGETQVLAQGSYPSYIKGTSLIVYERQGEIVMKNLRDGSETPVGPGRFPSADPQGNLLAYVKEETCQRQVADFAAVREVLADVWVADVKNPAVSKRVTANYPHYFTDEEEWLNGLTDSRTLQVLTFHGAYSYYNPVWGSDSQTLFVLKNSDAGGEKPSNMRLTRVDFSQGTSSPEDLVKKFIQSLVKRDEDYARSLMKEPGDSALTLSNPRQVGYTVLSTGTEQSRVFVEAEVYWQYTALPFYEIVKSRFYLCDSHDGYLIDSITDLCKLQVYEKEGDVWIDDGEGKTLLLEKNRISNHLPQGSPYKLASLAYHENSHTLVMALQTTDQNLGAGVRLATYNIGTDDFRLRADIGAEKVNPGVSKLTVDPDGRYAAVDLYFQDDGGTKSTVYLCDLLQGENTDILHSFSRDIAGDRATVSFWCGDCLLFEIQKGGQTMSYLFKPGEESPIQVVGGRR